MLQDSLSFVPTRASQRGGDSAALAFTSVVFGTARKSKNASTKLAPNKEKPEDEKGIVAFELEQAKRDVRKLAMSGFAPKEKEQAKVRQLVRLGARPPKNKYKNYKEVLKERAKEKEAKKALELEFVNHKKKTDLKGKPKTKRVDVKKRPHPKKRAKKGPGGLLDVYGKVTRPK